MKSVLISTLFSILLLFSVYLNAQKSDYLIIAATDVNMRELPNPSSKLITKLQFGQLGKIERKSEKEESLGIDLGNEVDRFFWYKITVNGQSGWVYGAYAFETFLLENISAPADWYYGKSSPDWYKKNVSVYKASCGSSGMMGYTPSFYFMVNTDKINSGSKVILFEADATLDSGFLSRYRGYLSNGGGGDIKFSIGYDEKQKLLIFIETAGLCEMCRSFELLEGTYNSAKKSYLFTSKFSRKLY